MPERLIRTVEEVRRLVLAWPIRSNQGSAEEQKRALVALDALNHRPLHQVKARRANAVKVLAHVTLCPGTGEETHAEGQTLGRSDLHGG